MSAYIFLDESGNFDFGASGTRYLVLTSVGMCRPFPAGDRLDDYKYHCIETGTDIERFHCYADRWGVRHQSHDHQQGAEPAGRAAEQAFNHYANEPARDEKQTQPDPHQRIHPLS